MAQEFNRIKGNLINLAASGEFDCIAHGVNCFSTQKAGLAPQMVTAFGTDEFPMELTIYRDVYGKIVHTDNHGNPNKLGNYDYKTFKIIGDDATVTNEKLTVINAYSQYEAGFNSIYPGEPPINYEALRLIFLKMNREFAGKHIGLPKIGCELAGGDENIIIPMMEKEFTKCRVTLVEYDGKPTVYNFKRQEIINE